MSVIFLMIMMMIAGMGFRMKNNPVDLQQVTRLRPGIQWSRGLDSQILRERWICGDLQILQVLTGMLASISGSSGLRGSPGW